MARPRAGRPLIARVRPGRLGRPLAAGAPSGAARLPRARPAPRRARPRPAAGAARRALHLAHAALGLLSRHRRLRIALLVCLVSTPPLVGGWMWLRHSSLVAVKHVRVHGVHGPEAHAIEAALDGAARRMSTLDVNLRALRAAVAPFVIVRDVRATASFPHGLEIHVTEQPPVAALLAGGTRTAAAADGVVLGPALLSSGLPTVTGSSLPRTGARMGDSALLGALSVLGAAPAPFAKLLARAFTGSNGLTVAMRNGLLAYFGDARRPHAKWASLARVLSDPGAAGASYVDVRVPERPAAGFPSGAPPLATSAPPSGASGESGTPSAAGSEGTVAALAGRLANSTGVTGAAKENEAAAGSEPEPQGAPKAIEGGGSSSSETTHTPSGEAGAGGATPTTKGP